MVPEFIASARPKEIENVVERIINSGNKDILMHHIRYRNLDVDEFVALYEAGVEVYERDD